MSFLVRGSALLGLFTLAASSCGGRTNDPPGSSGGSAGRASGGSAGTVGGSAGSLGSSGAAGNSGRGGNSGAGGTGGIGGTGGSGGSGGSGGTGGGNHGACTLTSQCMVRPLSCCGSCGAATRTDVIAINRANAASYTLEKCRDTGCPDCYMTQDPNLQARCQNGACRVLDLNALHITECSLNSDCRVRVASCCECGGDVGLSALIAIRKDAEAEYQELMCDPGTGCDACVPPYPQGAIGVCLDGRCAVSGFSGATPQAP